PRCDHLFGLPRLVTPRPLDRRSQPLMPYRPPAVNGINNLDLYCSQTELRYPLEFIPVDAGAPTRLLENSEITVETIIMNHRIPCTGFLFREKPRLPNIIREKIQEYAIPSELISSIKQGMDLRLPDGRD